MMKIAGGIPLAALSQQGEALGNIGMSLRLSIVCPFKYFGQEVRAFLNSLRLAGINRDECEVILIHDEAESSCCPRETLYAEFALLPLRILHYRSSGGGASEVWCYGAKLAYAETFVFLASDTIVDRSWWFRLRAILPARSFCIGSYFLPLETNNYATIESRIDLARFWSHNRVDFRNFICNRQKFLDILSEYFGYRYCSDTELDVLIDVLGEEVIELYPTARIYNLYPNSLVKMLKRKFAHGFGSGRIYLYFTLPLLRRRAQLDLRGIVKPIFELLGGFIPDLRSRVAKKQACLHFIAHSGFVIGFLFGVATTRKSFRRLYQIQG